MTHIDKQIPIFVVSLADAKDRRHRIASALGRLGLEFTFFDAVDGRDQLPSSYESQVDRPAAHRRLGRPITDAELACALSHVHLYEKLAQLDISGAIILEDDAIIDGDFRSFIEHEYFKDHEFIMLGHQMARVSIFYNMPVFDRYEFRKLNFPACLTVGYYITKKVASELLRESIPISHVADWGPDITRFNALAISPPIVRHLIDDTNNSTLAPQRTKAELMREVKKKSRRRYLQLEYWRLKILKLVSVEIPGSLTETEIDK